MVMWIDQAIRDRKCCMCKPDNNRNIKSNQFHFVIAAGGWYDQNICLKCVCKKIRELNIKNMQYKETKGF